MPEPETSTAVACSVQKFADMSGLSESTVRRYVKAGKLPHDQPGGPRCRILIPLSALPSTDNKSVAGDPETRPTAAMITDQAKQPQTLERLPGPKPRWVRQGPAASLNESRGQNA